MKSFDDILYLKENLDKTNRFNEKYNYDAATLMEAIVEFSDQFKTKWYHLSDIKPMSYKLVLVWDGNKTVPSCMKGDGTFDIDNVLQWAELPIPMEIPLTTIP